jgi:TrmH family RNA methyltransferase
MAALKTAFQSERLRVVLVAARNPLNIGAAARAMSNFGFERLRVVNPYAIAFREARSAVGASAVLARAEEFKSIADAVADCKLVIGTTGARQRLIEQPLYRLDEATGRIRRALASGPVALLFGSEKTGLSRSELGHCHWLLRIPTREEHLSMNLGQAVAVCLYELIRERKAEAAESVTRAAAGDVERITELLMEALRASGYVKPRVSTSTEEKVRRLVRRLVIGPDDANLLLGMLRQILWKIQAREE